MNDMISRQAAIDAMAELQGRASTKAELKGISKAWKRIKQLPPAQPEIIHCKDCKHSLKSAGYMGTGYYLCGKNPVNYDWEDNDFCSRAERREVTE